MKNKKKKLKFKKKGLFLSICWIIITILHTITYGFWAGIILALATINIILYQLE